MPLRTWLWSTTRSSLRTAASGMVAGTPSTSRENGSCASGIISRRARSCSSLRGTGYLEASLRLEIRSKKWEGAASVFVRRRRDNQDLLPSVLKLKRATECEMDCNRARQGVGMDNRARRKYEPAGKRRRRLTWAAEKCRSRQIGVHTSCWTAGEVGIEVIL